MLTINSHYQKLEIEKLNNEIKALLERQDLLLYQIRSLERELFLLKNENEAKQVGIEHVAKTN